MKCLNSLFRSMHMQTENLQNADVIAEMQYLLHEGHSGMEWWNGILEWVN